ERLRKVLHKSSNLRTLSAPWGSLPDAHSLERCSSLSQSPKQWNDILELKIQELTVLFSYGHKPNVKYIKLAKMVMHQTGVAFQHARWVVNFLPARIFISVIRVPARFPGAGFQRWAQESRRLFLEVTRQPFYYLKNEIMMGNTWPMSFAQQNFECLPETHTTEDEEIIMFSSDSLFSGQTSHKAINVLRAGNETVRAFSSIQKHNEIFLPLEAKCDEIQAKIGKRWPNPQDRDALPFIDINIQEVHRMYPPIPLITHSNTQEEHYENYRIPQKAWVIGNT
ncbi:hypothetical protein IW261DRAFT_1330613, partial [Armillaria novae-zelandiae]